MKNHKALLTISFAALLITSQAWAGDRDRGRYENNYRDHGRVERHYEYREHGSRFAPGRRYSDHSQHHYYAERHKPRYYSGHYYRGHHYHSRHCGHDYGRHHGSHDAYKWLAGGVLLSEIIHH